MATSLDGQIALKSGESKWITSEASRDYVHELRSYYDAILVGRKTIEIDDPSLNIRHSKISKENKIIVLDPAAKILTKLISGQNFKFIKAHKPENIFFAVHRKVDSPYNQVEFTDLLDLMNQLWKHNIRSILIEGGAATYSSFLNAELIDRIYIFMAPVLLGAGGSVSWTQGFSMPTLEKKIELQSFKVKSIGSDVLFTGLPKFH